ncbi:RDD family protein [Bacillus halotolerans]|uniref:RDD family protein n=1 Tax=Bacillus halotolerans TaxID=260554 RepID=A0A9Q4EK79_9BACI|nr:RDD family protein [Bacillus halotolerans]MCY9185190.1 RDD family protein [Bacillus halotolerans]MCY9200536.1 RDD family protein [Bacillus halotolerans]
MRLGASLLDYIIVSVPLLLIYWLITGKDPNDSMIISLVVLLYSILLPVFWQGYLIGKRICGIRIVKKDGSQVVLVTMIMRVIIAGLVYGITFGLGLIVSLFMIGLREDKRTLHDFIAGTYVTYASPGEEELYTDEQIRRSE